MGVADDNLQELVVGKGQHTAERRVRGGRASVRAALYMAALGARRFSPVFKHIAGKSAKVILTARMRRLLIILNKRVKTNSSWNPKLAS